MMKDGKRGNSTQNNFYGKVNTRTPFYENGVEAPFEGPRVGDALPTPPRRGVDTNIAPRFHQKEHPQQCCSSTTCEEVPLQEVGNSRINDKPHNNIYGPDDDQRRGEQLYMNQFGGGVNCFNNVREPAPGLGNKVSNNFHKSGILHYGKNFAQGGGDDSTRGHSWRNSTSCWNNRHDMTHMSMYSSEDPRSAQWGSSTTHHLRTSRGSTCSTSNNIMSGRCQNNLRQQGALSSQVEENDFRVKKEPLSQQMGMMGVEGGCPTQVVTLVVHNVRNKLTSVEILNLLFANDLMLTELSKLRSFREEIGVYDLCKRKMRWSDMRKTRKMLSPEEYRGGETLFSTEVDEETTTREPCCVDEDDGPLLVAGLEKFFRDEGLNMTMLSEVLYGVTGVASAMSGVQRYPCVLALDVE